MVMWCGHVSMWCILIYRFGSVLSLTRTTQTTMIMPIHYKIL